MTIPSGQWINDSYKSVVKKIPLQGYKCGLVTRWSLYSANYVIYVTESLSKGYPNGLWTVSLYSFNHNNHQAGTKIAHRRMPSLEEGKTICEKMLEYAEVCHNGNLNAEWETTVF